jgi:hypothetical protein
MSSNRLRQTGNNPNAGGLSLCRPRKTGLAETSLSGNELAAKGTFQAVRFYLSDKSVIQTSGSGQEDTTISAAQ